MARGINKVILIGNLGQDPDVKYTPSGTAIANLSIATSESWKDKNTGETKEKTEWHKLVFFSKLAEVCGEYLKKGSKIYVEGKLSTEEWEDKSGQKRYTTKIICNSLQMLDGATKGDGHYKPPPPETTSAPANDFDDDIPF